MSGSGVYIRPRIVADHDSSGPAWAWFCESTDRNRKQDVLGLQSRVQIKLLLHALSAVQFHRVAVEHLQVIDAVRRFVGRPSLHLDPLLKGVVHPLARGGEGHGELSRKGRPALRSAHRYGSRQVRGDFNRGRTCRHTRSNLSRLRSTYEYVRTICTYVQYVRSTRSCSSQVEMARRHDGWIYVGQRKPHDERTPRICVRRITALTTIRRRRRPRRRFQRYQCHN